MSLSNSGELDVQQSSFVRCNLDLLDELPKPPETFLRAELIEEKPYLENKFDLLIEVGVLERVSRVFKNYGGDFRWRWQVKEAVADAADEYSEHDRGAYRLPCGHHGLKNIGDDRYQCKLCGETCDRDEVELL